MPATTAPQVRFRTLDGVRIRYVGGGGSQSRRSSLPVPWPESVYAFASSQASLSGHAHR